MRSQVQNATSNGFCARLQLIARLCCGLRAPLGHHDPSRKTNHANYSWRYQRASLVHWIVVKTTQSGLSVQQKVRVFLHETVGQTCESCESCSSAWVQRKVKEGIPEVKPPETNRIQGSLVVKCEVALQLHILRGRYRQ